jgi:hypothetical protein
MENKSDEINMQNLRQPETFGPVANEYLDYEHVSPYHKRELFQRLIGSLADTEQRKFQGQRWDESNM